jgi:hypothetical protein
VLAITQGLTIMAQAHKDYILSTLAEGSDPSEASYTLESWGIPEDQVLALDPSYEFLPEDSYDPMCDIPDYHQGRGVTVNPVNRNQAVVVGDEGRCLFCFILRGNVA